MKPVDQNDVGLCHRHGIGRARFVDMRVAVRPDDGDDVHTVAADVLGEIGNDGEAGHHLERCGEGR